MSIDHTSLDTLLSALGEQLGDLGVRHELVVVGGSALLAMGLVTRTTRDVDVVALAEGGELLSADPLPESLQTAVARVARDFSLNEDWLNPGPIDLLRWGLPDGFWSRVVPRRYGDPLVVHFASRFDQIHFQALCHGGPGRGSSRSGFASSATDPKRTGRCREMDDHSRPVTGIRGDTAPSAWSSGSCGC